MTPAAENASAPSPSPAPPTPLRLASPAGRGVLLATVLGSSVAFLDGTVVNVALATLGRDMNASLTDLQWTVNAYMLTLSSLLLVGGALGDHFGRKRIFILGLFWFVLASALCGWAPTIQALNAARALQGIGAAMLVPGSLALLRSTFDSEDQGTAIGAWSGLSGVATTLGPLVGGWLVSLSWRSIFFINVPLGLAALWAAIRYIPESRDEAAAHPIDVLGALFATLGLGGVVYALTEGPAHGWETPEVLFSGAIGIAAFATFFKVETSRPHPMLPLKLFRSLRFSGANLTTLTVYFALGGATFLLVLQLQQTLGYRPLTAGMALMPVSLIILGLSSRAGALIGTVGYRVLIALGSLLVGLSFVLFSRIVPGASYWAAVFPGALVLGLGLAAIIAPLSSAVLGSVGVEYAGMASAVNNAVSRLAGLLAVALLPWAGGIIEGSTGEAFSAGFQKAMLICAGFCAAGAACAWFTLRPPPRRRQRPVRGLTLPS